MRDREGEREMENEWMDSLQKERERVDRGLWKTEGQER